MKEIFFIAALFMFFSVVYGDDDCPKPSWANGLKLICQDNEKPISASLKILGYETKENQQEVLNFIKKQMKKKDVSGLVDGVGLGRVKFEGVKRSGRNMVFV